MKLLAKKNHLVASSPATLRAVNITQHLILTADETWDSYCLTVMLSDFVVDCTLPEVYLGARVFYEYGGVCLYSTADYCGAVASQNFSLLFGSVLVVLFLGCACCVCRLRRRACKSQKCAFQRLPVEDPSEAKTVMMPMMMPPPSYMVPAEFDIEMMNGEQMPYEPVMIPVGYHHPMFTHPQQPVWFVPPRPQQQQ